MTESTPSEAFSKPTLNFFTAPQAGVGLRTAMLLGFWPLTALVLFCDSSQLAGVVPFGQTASTVLALGYLLTILACTKPDRRLALSIFVVLAAIGECLFSLIFDLYEYRLGGVPLYVPLGHSILMGTALLFADLDWIQRRQTMVRIGLGLLHGGLILGALLLFRDTLSTLFTVIFLLLLRKRGTEPFFLILGVLVLYVELLGTTWNCWSWRPDSFTILHTTNPPMGAFTAYAAGEMLALYLAPKIRNHQVPN